MTITAVRDDINNRVVTGMSTATLRSVLLSMLAETETTLAALNAEIARSSGVDNSLSARIAVLEGSPVPLPAPGAGTTVVTDAQGTLDPYWRRLTTTGNRGSFPNLADLRLKIPTGRTGDWAVISNGAGVDPNVVIWDTDETPPGWRAAASDTAMLGTIIADVQALQAALAAEVLRATTAEANEVVARDAAIAAAIAALVNGAGAADDTLKELADTIAANMLADTSIGTRVTALETADASITALQGVPSGSSTLGTFAGVTIPDGETVKGALQSLETAVEALLPVVASTTAPTKTDVIWRNTAAAVASDIPPGGLAFHNGTKWKYLGGGDDFANLTSIGVTTLIPTGSIVDIDLFTGVTVDPWFATIVSATQLQIDYDGVYEISCYCPVTFLTPRTAATTLQMQAFLALNRGVAPIAHIARDSQAVYEDPAAITGGVTHVCKINGTFKFLSGDLIKLRGQASAVLPANVPGGAQVTTTASFPFTIRRVGD